MIWPKNCAIFACVADVAAAVLSAYAITSHTLDKCWLAAPSMLAISLRVAGQHNKSA